MRYLQTILLPVLVLAIAFTPGFSRAQPSGYAITQQGADYRVLSETTIENGTSRVHQYTELATGLNYTNGYGQLVESKEEISILPNGGAAAVQGQHQVYFPADIYNGVLQVVTPDGRHLKSRPLGVSYDDGSNTVFIATLTNSIGVLTASNQVTYPNAFTAFKADLVCTYRKSGFECDLVFREKPPTPDAYGLDPNTSTLQLVTEFFNTQDPQEIPAAYDEWYGLQDDTLKFGKLTMTHGKAFAVGNPRPSDGRGQGEGKASVYKRWLHLQGRTFLIEELPLVDLADDLSTLPEATNALTRISNPAARIKKFASNHRQMPPAHEFVLDTKQIQIASASLNQKPGVVLDYDEIDSGTTDDYTFYADTTYFISGPISFGGNVTFEGGTVVKYPNDTTAYIEIDLSVTCPATTDRPAIFTAADDDSVGESMNGAWGGYSGTVSGYYANPAIAFNIPQDGETPQTLDNIRVNYAQQGVSSPNSWSSEDYYEHLIINDSQIINCHDAIVLSDFGDSEQAELDNCLVANVDSVFLSGDIDGDCDRWYINQSTIDNCSEVVNNPVCPQSEPFYATNSIFSNVGSWIMIMDDTSDYYFDVVGWSSYNGYYNTPGTLPGDNVITNTANPFQSAANAGYYFATSSPFRDVGTTDIDPDVLAEIQMMTTYAPQDGGWPDTNTPDLGYHYPVNEDSDYDGIPDWWIWQHFGNYNENGANLDANGNTILSDYQNSVDPSASQFWLSMTNMSLNTNQTSVQINLQGGWPAYVAVLVNDTNYADADWQPYTGTNLAVTLGTTDGEYNVWVGLRGWSTNATPTWDTDDITFTLDRVPPVVTITNPIIASGSATVIKPYLQLQGYGDENLLSVSYDITNAAGIFTNLDGYVTDKYFDQTLFDFTTNFFQCYDVALTNGLNLITLRVTDLAGNTTTTNFSVTLDYTTATIPPTIQLIWPQDGMAVSGASCTIRGTMSDETGGIVAQVVNGDGTTNILTGIVERNNMFWVENAPLNGTNQISIQATDAAGNVTTTNFTIMPSSLTLTIDSTPTGDDLYKPFGSVSGTVSDPSATVTMNGVAASVDGSGNWSADGVPVYGQGTATFDAVANTSGGESASASSAVEMGSYVAITHYDMTDHAWTDVLVTGWKDYDYTRQKNYDAWCQPDPAHPGQWQEKYVGSYSENGMIESDTIDWMDGWTDEVPGIGDESIPQEDLVRLFGYASHYFAKGVSHTWVDTNITTTTGSPAQYYATMEAHTQVKLYTGGKAGVSRNNLFGVNAWADEYGKPDNGGMASGDGGLSIWAGIPATSIDKTKLTVMGKHPDSSGNFYVVLPDNSEQDLTVIAPAKHYNAGAGAGKYKCHLQVFVCQPYPGFVNPNPWPLPPPLGFPIWNPFVMAGHAWWKLTTDAPDDAVNQFISTNDSQWLRREVGYGPINEWADFDWTLFFTSGFTSYTSPGELPFPDSATATVYPTYTIDFDGLKKGLNYTENLHEDPATYDLKNKNCCTTTKIAGAESGVTLPSGPNDWMPEYFGEDLPPASP